MFALRAPAAQAARRFSSTPLAAVKKPAADKAPEGQNLVANTALPNVGMAYGGSGGKGPLGGREGAMEDQWAYQHDKELVSRDEGWHPGISDASIARSSRRCSPA